MLLAAALKSAGFKPAEAVEGQSVQLYAEKGNYTRLGVYITAPEHPDNTCRSNHRHFLRVQCVPEPSGRETFVCCL